MLVDERGYGLTNYHVVMKMMADRKGYGGLSDGVLYEMEVLGVDITGDVAMFRLKGKDRFPFAELGESSGVGVGDPVIVAGNPFILAVDFTPTITTGIVTGIHRYQGESETLVYTDCIQTDAAVNPGNSGGPLFDADGRVIGINGRISAEMHRFARGRFNVGLGYAIAMDQIRRFIPTLRAGLMGKHGTLAATVVDDIDRVIFNEIYEDSPAWDAGIRVGNRLVRFGGEEIDSANEFASRIGTYPADWPVPVTYAAQDRVEHRVIRLEAVLPPIRGQYRVAEGANRDAMLTVMRAGQEAVLGGAFSASGGERSGDRPASWTWRATRTDGRGRVSQYRVTDKVKEGITRERLDDSGKVVRTIVSRGDGFIAVEGGRDIELSTEESLAMLAGRAIRWKLFERAESLSQHGAKHVGSDALVPIDGDGKVTHEQMLEAIELPLSEDVTLHIAFDLETHLPARLVATDIPSGTSVEIVLSDYRSFDSVAGAVNWPARWRVRGERLRYEESLEDLEWTR